MIVPGVGEFWKVYKGQLKKSMDFISEHGVSVLGEKEIKQIAVPIIREARKRVRELENADLTDSPAYRYLKREGIKLSAAGDNLNKIKHEVSEAHKFLMKQTSTVAGSRAFFTSTIDTWVGEFTTKEQREKIWDVYYRLEKIHPGYFLKEVYGSSELQADIYTIYQSLDESGWDLDETMERLQKEASDLTLTYEESEAIKRWSGWME